MSSMYLNNTLKFNFESKIPSIITDIIKIKVKWSHKGAETKNNAC